MRRDPLPWLLLLLLTVLGSIAWLTRDPDHPVLDRLAEWPVIGPAAERFREVYRPPPAALAGEEQPDGVGVVVAGREIVGRPPSAGASRPLERVWVRAGTEIHERPDPGSAVVETVAGLRMVLLADARGGWRRVSRAGLTGSVTGGWVRQADLGEPSVEELWQPEPVVPLAAAQPAEEILAQARELMGEDARERPCGPYRLITDVEGPLIADCGRLARQLDGLYGERTGLEPVGEAAEAILLFESEGAFLIFRARVSPESRRHAFAAPASGFVALATGGRPVGQTRSTLVHELIHLLNRRFLGPALPSWLDEGLAEELAMSRVAEDGTLVPASLGRWEAGVEGARLLGGGQVVLGSLRTSMRRGELPTIEALVRLDRAGFQAEEAFRNHYSLSAFWVRYLLSGESPASVDGFRLFLAAVAEGRPLDENLLLSSVGAGWGELETGFRRWLDEGAAG